MEENEYKVCPYCAESIKKEAIKCRYCKTFLEEDELESDQSVQEEDQEESAVGNEEAVTSQNEDYDAKEEISQLKEELKKETARNRNKSYWLLTAFVLIFGIWLYTYYLSDQITDDQVYGDTVETSTVFAEDIVLTNEDGEATVLMAGSSEDPEVISYIAVTGGLGEDVNSASLAINHQGPRFELLNDEGMIVMTIDDFGPMISLYDKNNYPRVGLSYSEEDGEVIYTLDDDGNVSGSLP